MFHENNFITNFKEKAELLNPFVPNAPFLFLLKTSENRKGRERR